MVTLEKSKGNRSRGGTNRAGVRDVARDAGVSVATVSRVLANDGYPVSDETRAKVLASVAKLHFVPNDLARGLSQDRTNTIGIIVPNIVNLYYAQLVMGVEEVAAQNGISTMICNTNSSSDKLHGDLRVLAQKRVDGILLCGSSPNPQDISDASIFRQIPTVAIGRNDKLEVPSIHADNIKAGYRATQHLIELGHTRIAYLSGTPNWADGADRVTGFKTCMLENDIAATDMILSFGSLTEEDAYNRMTDIWVKNQVTAVIGANDRVAIGAMASLMDLQVRIPEDVAVIGFDNIASGNFVRPSLTTMDIPARDMGAEAMRLLLKMQAGEAVPSRTVFDAPLLVRNSTQSHKDA
jgi:DNA-binding LacI/PurR family transcriptional regulator